ncbi:hypothetical protein ACPA9J_27150 [Pseudomonas aeruginosa]
MIVSRNEGHRALARRSHEMGGMPPGLRPSSPPLPRPGRRAVPGGEDRRTGRSIAAQAPAARRSAGQVFSQTLLRADGSAAALGGVSADEHQPDSCPRQARLRAAWHAAGCRHGSFRHRPRHLRAARVGSWETGPACRPRHHLPVGGAGSSPRQFAEDRAASCQRRNEAQPEAPFIGFEEA